MSETTNEDRMYPIEMTLQGARCCISIGKGVIKALGKPSHVSIKISDSHDSLSVFPCDEDDVMAFPSSAETVYRSQMRHEDQQQAIRSWNHADKPDGHFKDICFIRRVSGREEYSSILVS